MLVKNAVPDFDTASIVDIIDIKNISNTTLLLSSLLSCD